MDWKKVRIAVLCGGESSEREISLLSGAGVHQCLAENGFLTRQVDSRGDFLGTLKRYGAEFVFIALHGKFGEDGQVQSILEREGYAYSGSRPDGCRNAMDKIFTRRILSEKSIPCPAGFTVTRNQTKAPPANGYPFFVKPARGGSSIGVSRVMSASEWEGALSAAFQEDSEAIVESAVIGREFAVGILGPDVLPPIEVLPAGLFYDYRSKYQDSGTRYVFPGDLGPDQLEPMRQAALAAHQALGCECFSRVDMIRTLDGPFVLEVNAIPGLTPKSLLPKQAAAAGLSFLDLIKRILDESVKIRNADNRTVTSKVIKGAFSGS